MQSSQHVVLNIIYVRLERCLRLRFSVGCFFCFVFLIVSQSTKKASPYLGLDNHSTQQGQLCEYEYFSRRFTNNALSTYYICTVNIAKVY